MISERSGASRRLTPRTVGAAGALVALRGLAAAALSVAFVPAGVLNLLASRDGISNLRAIAYGEGARRRLDVYAPADAADAPLIVFFYGGSWQSGDRGTYLFVAAALARRGFVTIVPDYRVYPEVRYPDFLEDAARVVAWAKANAGRFGGASDNLFVMGHSAGAYLAAMLATDARWLGAEGLSPREDLSGLIGVAGPYDFLPIRDPVLKTIFGGAARPETQPISHVSGDEPPAILIAGDADRTVDPGNADRLSARLEENGVEAEVVRYPGVGHIAIIGAFAAQLRFVAPALRDVEAFVNAHARSGSGS